MNLSNMKRFLTALVLMSAAAVGAAPAVGSNTAGADEAAVRKCNRAVDDSLTIVAARNMSCRAAARVMGRYEGQIKRKFNTDDGFHCQLRKGNVASGSWRCTRNDRWFRFAFGD